MLFLPNREAENFLPEGWTATSQNCPTGKSVLSGRSRNRERIGYGRWKELVE
jgi:hypothetical protein